MPRAPRIHVDEGLYFVTTRCDHSGTLFNDDTDRAQYIDLLGKYKSQYSFKLFSYMLMVNLVHLLVQLEKDTTISEVMHVINSTYTKYFNGRYEKRGHLFQQRFGAVLAEKDTYLADLTRYIHLLPVKSHLAQKPEDYRWSSCRVYFGAMGEKTLDIKDDSKEVLSRFGTIPDAQLKGYANFLNSMNSELLEQMRKRIERARILGSKEFVDQIKNKEKEDTKQKEKEWTESRPHKVFMVAGGAMLAILILFTIYFYRANLGLKGILEQNRTTYGEQLRQEKKKMKNDLQEKYKTEMVSYDAMKKKLENENKPENELK